MSIIPWKSAKREPALLSAPFGDIRRLRTEMDRLFDRFFEAPWWGLGETALTTAAAWEPVTDVSENDRDITIRAEIPGIDPKDVEVTVCGNILTISGRKSESSEQKGEDYYHSERRFGSFRRSIELPPSADLEKLSARHENGVVTVRAPKLETARGRQVPILGATEKEKGKKPAAMAGAAGQR